LTWQIAGCRRGSAEEGRARHKKLLPDSKDAKGDEIGAIDQQNQREDAARLQLRNFSIIE
jgi:hypothetical protein